MSTNTPIIDLQEKNAQLLRDIQNLQSIEQDLFINLEQNEPNLTSDQKNSMIQKINEISQIRLNLYKSLSGLNSFYQGALVSSRDTLDEQTVAIGIVEEQLNDAKKRLALVEEEKNNKIRVVEINNYYGEKYSEHSNLMKLIIFLLVPLIILAILYNSNLLTKNIYFLLTTLVSLIGFYFIIRRVLSILFRSNMNYQEYNWYFDPKDAPDIGDNGDITDPWSLGEVVCVGDECCTKYSVYDASMNKCVPLNYSNVENQINNAKTGTTTDTTTTDTTTTDTTTTDPTTTESFANHVFTKHMYYPRKY